MSPVDPNGRSCRSRDRKLAKFKQLLSMQARKDDRMQSHGRMMDLLNTLQRWMIHLYCSTVKRV